MGISKIPAAAAAQFVLFGTAKPLTDAAASIPSLDPFVSFFSPLLVRESVLLSTALLASPSWMAGDSWPGPLPEGVSGAKALAGSALSISILLTLRVRRTCLLVVHIRILPARDLYLSLLYIHLLPRDNTRSRAYFSRSQPPL